jgi:hypothetical protein
LCHDQQPAEAGSPSEDEAVNAIDHIPHDKVPDQQVTNDTMKTMIPETVDASYY